MESNLLLGVPSAPPSSHSVFAQFEGLWVGRWGSLRVRHLWRTLDSQTQLVVIGDEARLRHGINYIDHDGVLCGLVEDDGNSYRLHVGRLRHASLDAPAVLEWTTSTQRYDERVVETVRGPRYEIVSTQRGGDMMSATYRRPPPDHPDAWGTAEAAGVTFEWSIRHGEMRVVLRGRTDGWVGVAFGTGPSIVGSRVYLGRVRDGRADVGSFVATTAGPRLLTSGPASEVGNVTGRQADGETVVAFSFSMHASDELPSVRRGEELTVWLAWSESDDFDRHSAQRRSLRVRF